MDLFLKGRFMIFKVLKKTKAKMFMDLKQDDIIELTVDLSPTGYSRNGIYAKYINCSNLITGDKSEFSFNQLAKILECFKLKQIL
jgi:hypothetical protein